MMHIYLTSRVNAPPSGCILFSDTINWVDPTVDGVNEPLLVVRLLYLCKICSRQILNPSYNSPRINMTMQDPNISTNYKDKRVLMCILILYQYTTAIRTLFLVEK